MQPRRLSVMFGFLVLGFGVCSSYLSAQTSSVGTPSAPGTSAPPAQSKRPNLPAGPNNDFISEVFGWDFQPGASTTTTGFTIIGAGVALRTTTGGTGELVGPVHLPTGVVIDFIELDACDASVTNDGNVGLYQLADPFTGPGGATLLTSVSTSGSSGCAFYQSAPGLGVTVDNLNNEYELNTLWPSDANLGLRGVKIYYKLQVSPAPGTATFVDVPTTDFAFQFVEAFNAAGVTVGCNASPPMFCPDNNVTRREMAVFFAKAIGLNWPD
jgi:hypothetical protein